MTYEDAYEINIVSRLYPEKHYWNSEEVSEASEKVFDACSKADKYRGHDLRKNPEDLPKVEKPYLCQIETMGKYSNEPKTKLEYCVLGRYQIMNLKEFVIAWREIEPFEEET